MSSDNRTFEHFVIFTAFGESCSIAKKLKDEGKDVILAMVDDLKHVDSEEGPEEHKRRMENYDGVVEKMSAEKAIRELASVKDKDSYFLYFDLNCLYRFAEQALKLGFKYGNFPTKEDYAMESDRDKAKEIVKKYYPDLKIAPVFDFSKIEEAMKFLEEDKGGFFALKGNSDGAKTVVPLMEDSEICKSKLRECLEKGKSDYESKGFILETRIPSPMEYTPQAVFMDGELVFMDVDIENKPIGSGNIGYQVGAAQTLVCPVEERSQLARIAFPPFVHALAKKHVGIFTIDASILEDRRDGSRYFGEFCFNRFGYDSLYAEIAMSRSASGFFEDIVNGINPLIRDYGVAVRIFNLPVKAPYLYKNDDLKDMGIDCKTYEGLWPFDMKDVDGLKMTTGYSTDACVATGWGVDPHHAESMAYDNAEQYGLLNAYFRPKEDMRGEYKTSIHERFEIVRHMKESHQGVVAG